MARPIQELIISETELAPFVSGAGDASKAHGLLQQQKGAWELLRNGYNTLQTVRTRVFDFDGAHVKIQFNPGRMISTTAKVDAQSIRERKCFLCLENLPPAQRGIPCDGDYLVLCNPFPIFPEHFTIAFLRHTPQRIRDSFAAFLSLTRQLGGRYLVFYNGPKCGASAPDHLHFQAGDKTFLPMDTEYAAIRDRHASRLVASHTLRAFSIEACLRRLISFESPDAGALRRAFEALHDVLQEGVPPEEEPMMNILGFYEQQQWRIIVFPRAKHRPAFYFREGDDKLMISPAAVEMGGVCTTPREQDFEKVTHDHIIQMYDEVSVSAETFAGIKQRLALRLASQSPRKLS